MLGGANIYKHKALSLMLGVLQWIGRHGGWWVPYYDPLTVKHERETERMVG